MLASSVLLLFGKNGEVPVGGFDTRFMFKYGHSVSARRGLAAQHAITGKLEKNYTASRHWNI
jgi:hypothetical protein